MEITSNSLQELINKKAEAKANAEIKTLITALKASGILEIEGFYLKESEKTRGLQFCLLDSSFRIKDNILTILYERKVSEYIISETKDFVKKVELLSEQTENLLNIANNF